MADSMQEIFERALAKQGASDLILRCEALPLEKNFVHEWKVHKAVVCSQSLYFDRAIKFLDASTHSENAVSAIKLHDITPEFASRMMCYLYTGTYVGRPGEDEIVATFISHHLEMLRLGERFLIRTLENSAINDCYEALGRWVNTWEYEWNLEMKLLEVDALGSSIGVPLRQAIAGFTNQHFYARDDYANDGDIMVMDIRPGGFLIKMPTTGHRSINDLLGRLSAMGWPEEHG